MRSEAKAEVTTSKPGAASVFFFCLWGWGGDYSPLVRLQSLRRKSVKCQSLAVGQSSGYVGQHAHVVGYDGSRLNLFAFCPQCTLGKQGWHRWRAAAVHLFASRDAVTLP